MRYVSLDHAVEFLSSRVFFTLKFSEPTQLSIFYFHALTRYTLHPRFALGEVELIRLILEWLFASVDTIRNHHHQLSMFVNLLVAFSDILPLHVLVCANFHLVESSKMPGCHFKFYVAGRLSICLNH